jgi:MinD-like ATPase involved in chromosome partitioning or flagellar assembly
MKQIHRLLALGITLLLTTCCSNPYFNEDGLKSLLKEKTGIAIEDSLTITDFEWVAAIGGDYSEEYTLKCSLNDYEEILDHVKKNKWEDLERGYRLIIIPITIHDTLFVFALDKYSQIIVVQIVKD